MSLVWAERLCLHHCPLCPACTKASSDKALAGRHGLAKARTLLFSKGHGQNHPSVTMVLLKVYLLSGEWITSTSRQGTRQDHSSRILTQTQDMGSGRSCLRFIHLMGGTKEPVGISKPVCHQVLSGSPTLEEELGWTSWHRLMVSPLCAAEHLHIPPKSAGSALADSPKNERAGLTSTDLLNQG